MTGLEALNLPQWARVVAMALAALLLLTALVPPKPHHAVPGMSAIRLGLAATAVSAIYTHATLFSSPVLLRPVLADVALALLLYGMMAYAQALTGHLSRLWTWRSRMNTPEAKVLRPALTGFLVAATALAATFGLDVSQETQETVLAAVLGALPLIHFGVGYVTRHTHRPDLPGHNDAANVSPRPAAGLTDYPTEGTP